jgi:hypothetical protein
MSEILEPPILSVERLKCNRRISLEERQCLLRSLELASLAPVDTERRNFVELGVFKGLTSRIIIRALTDLKCKSSFYAVDLDQESWDEINRKLGGWKPSGEFHKNCADVLNTEYCNAMFVAGDSTQFSSNFSDESISWCFIDACHCYECVMKDLVAYTPKVVKGGFILLDDTRLWDMKNSQWYHDKDNPRPFGILRALNDCQVFRDQFELIFNIHVRHGIQAWRKK